MDCRSHQGALGGAVDFGAQTEIEQAELALRSDKKVSGVGIGVEQAQIEHLTRVWVGGTTWNMK